MQLKFLINNFSIKAIDKFNKKISYGSIEMMEERGEKSIVSIETKPSFNNKNKKALATPTNACHFILNCCCLEYTKKIATV